jgi:soluble lytic murein transglycosylase-like protein
MINHKRTPQGTILRRLWPWLIVFILILTGATLAWTQRDRLRSSQALYAEAQRAQPERARALYDLLAIRMPEIEEYARLWSAEAGLPSLDAVEALHALTRYRPDSPSAFLANLALARYYASIESPQAVTAYRAALKIDNRAEIRLELARYLEEQNLPASAYEEYKAMLGRQWPDAFAGMRRTASDELLVATDLLAHHHCSDVLDVLREETRCDAHRLRAEALTCLDQADEAALARQSYTDCLAPPPTPKTPDGEPLSEQEPDAIDEQDALNEDLDTEAPDADQQPDNQDEEPPEEDSEALPIEDPIGLWTATWAMEEEGHIEDALEAYLALAALDVYVADDAAYRAWVLAQEREDDNSAQRALNALLQQGPSWLAYRATGELELIFTPDYPQEAIDGLARDVLAKVEALEHLRRDDLALQELRLAARVSETPEVILRMGQALAERGQAREAYSLGQAHLVQYGEATKAFWQLAYPRAHIGAVLESAATYDVEPALLWAIMRRESAFDAAATSPVGARGLMQIMPATQREIAEQMGLRYEPGHAYTPDVNIRLGAAYVSQMLTQFEGDMELALMAYNAGPAAVSRWLQDPQIEDRHDLLRFAWYGETREYLQRVGLDYLIYQQVWADES